MFIKYQILMYADNRIVDSIRFMGYDDFSATAKAKRVYNSGYYDIVALSRNGKNVNKFPK